MSSPTPPGARHRKAAEDAVRRFAATDRGPIASFGTRCTAQALADQEAEIAEVARARGEMLCKGESPDGEEKESDRSAMYAAGRRLFEFSALLRSGDWRKP